MPPRLLSSDVAATFNVSEPAQPEAVLHVRHQRGLGLLLAIAGTGFFDIFSYGAHSLLVLFTPFRKPEKHQKYYEYKLMKDARRQKPKPRTLILGACFLLLATVCLVMGDRIGRQIV